MAVVRAGHVAPLAAVVTFALSERASEVVCQFSTVIGGIKKVS